jgi:hypothetical protein
VIYFSGRTLDLFASNIWHKKEWCDQGEELERKIKMSSWTKKPRSTSGRGTEGK